jgi:hypothetical protein
MKRREAKFVYASPRMSPDQIKAAPRLREDRPRTTGKGVGKTARAVVAVERPQNRKRS